MKTFFKRTLSVIMVLTMVMGLVSVGFATDEDADSVNSKVGEVELNAANGTIGEEFEKAMSGSGDIQVNVILDAEIQNNIMNITFRSTEKATIVAAFYTEEGKMIDSVKKSVDASEEIVNEELSLTSVALPKYFVYKIFLLNSNNAALSKEYIGIEHTEALEEFFDKTVDDFGANIVLNYDESENNNFAVLADGAKEAISTVAYNKLVSVDEETGTYVFDSINSDIKSLSAGDLLYFNDGESVGNGIVIKIASISVVGDEAVIIEDKDAEIEDLYSFIKIDFSTDPSENGQIVDSSNLGEGVTYLGKVETEGVETANAKKDVAVGGGFADQVGDEFSLSTDIGDLKLTGQITVSITSAGRMFYDPDVDVEWWGIIPVDISFEQYLLIEFTITPAITGTIGISGEYDEDIFITTFDLVSPVGVTAGVEVFIAVNISAGVEFTIAELTRTIGFRYENTSGYKNLTNDPEVKISPDMKTKVNGSLGVKLKPNVTLIKVVEVNISGEIGGEISAEDTIFSSDGSKKHACLVCFDGELDMYAKATIGAEFLNKPIEADLGPKYTKQILTFYYSVDYDEFRINEDCPHIAYRVNFTVKDDEDRKVKNAVINSGGGASNKPFNNNSETVTTDSYGKASYYYVPGKYTASASATDYNSGSVYFQVVDFERDETIVLEYTGEEPPEDPTDPSDPGGTVGNISWHYNQATKTLTLTGSGNMQNYSANTAPWHQYYEEMERINVGSGITSIGNYSFYQCRNVDTLSLPDTLTNIGMAAFYGCNSLPSIVIGDKVKTIGNYAFFDCYQATSLTLGSSVETIGMYAFAQCESVPSVVVPASVKSIGEAAFKACHDLAAIKINNGSCYIHPSENTIPNTAVIYGLSGSTAQTYANNNNRSFVVTASVKTASIVASSAADGLNTQSASSKYYATASGAIEGEEYVLLVIKKNASFTPANLLYIDQKNAEKSGDITFTFIPKDNSNCEAYVIGKFTNSDQITVNPQLADKPVLLTVSKLPSKTSYIYKESSVDLSGIVLTATYYDGSTEEITDTTLIDVVSFSIASVGEQTVVIEYNGVEAEYEIDVSYAWWQWIIRILLLGFIWY